MVALFTRLRRGAAVALGATLLAAGCSLSTDGSDRPVLSVQYFLLETPPPPGAPPTIAVLPSPRAFQIDGQFVTPCATSRGDVRQQISGSDITIRVIFSSTAGCTGGLAIRYVVSLVSVRPGTYNLHVIHEGDTQVANGTVVYENAITVPDAVVP